MSTENAEVGSTPAAPAADSSPSFADAYADLMGDLTHVSDEPDNADDAASPDGSTAQSSEGAASAEPAGDTPAVATPTTPDDASPTGTDADPFEGSGPAAYRVNGEDRTFDGITVLKDRSGVIDPDKMDLVLHRLSERDHLFETSQARQKELTDLQELTRWRPDPAKDEYVTGAAALQARDLAYATTRAERDVYNALLSDPSKVAGLIQYNEATGQFEWNASQVAVVQAQLENKKLQLSHAIEKHYAPRIAGQPQTAQSAQAQRVDPVAAAERLIQVTGVKGFGDADKQWLAGLAEELVRPATPADVAKNPTLVVGQPFAPQKLLDLIADRAELLARSMKQVASATKAEKENQARFAAANAGKKPAAAQARATATKEKTQAQTRQEAFDAEYERRQDAMAGLLRATTAA